MCYNFVIKKKINALHFLSHVDSFIHQPRHTFVVINNFIAMFERNDLGLNTEMV